MSTPHSAAASKGSLWAWFPAALLGTMFVGLGSMAYVAVNDPGFALEPNYYDKAVHWDQSQAEVQASQKLGLQTKLSKPLLMDASGKVALELTVLDRSGAAFTGAALHVQAFANARASYVQELELREVSPGVYEAAIPHSFPGLWELRVQLTRGAERYRETLRSDVLKGPTA